MKRPEGRNIVDFDLEDVKIEPASQLLEEDGSRAVVNLKIIIVGRWAMGGWSEVIGRDGYQAAYGLAQHSWSV